MGAPRDSLLCQNEAWRVLGCFLAFWFSRGGGGSNRNLIWAPVEDERSHRDCNLGTCSESLGRDPTVERVRASM